MRYAPLAVERLGAAGFVLPAYAAKPTRRERVSRRGPSGAGERAARALTQERAQRTVRRLPAGRTQRPAAGQGSGPRAASTREASPAMESLPQRPDLRHTARPVQDRSTYSGAERPVRGCGDTLSPRDPPAYARDVSGTRMRRLFPGTPRACDHGPPVPKPVWHTLRPALAARPWERSWLVHTARPGLDAGVLRQYIPNACVEWALGPRPHTALPSECRRTGLLTAARPEVAGTPRGRTP